MWIDWVDFVVTMSSIGLGLFSLWLSWSVAQDVWLTNKSEK